VLLSSGALEDVARWSRNSEEQLNDWDETLSQWVPCTVIDLAKKWSWGPNFQEKWSAWSTLGITVRVRCLIAVVVYEKDTVQC